ncbi:MAG: hypothetical protein ACP5MK_02130 [Candidatus Micrarchaeia archaeon]
MKFQSAMEYLMTYGWALLIMAVVLAALFAMGIFNPSNFAGQECILPAGFSCLNYYLYQNGTAQINLQQATQSPINVTAIGCAQNTSAIVMQAPYNPPSNQIYMPIGANYTFMVKCYNSAGSLYTESPGTLFTGSLVINYTETLTGFPHTIYGTIAVKVS